MAVTGTLPFLVLAVPLLTGQAQGGLSPPSGTSLSRPELRAGSCSALWRHSVPSLPRLSAYPGSIAHSTLGDTGGVFIFPGLPAQ